jgi:hypothetical protein
MKPFQFQSNFSTERAEKSCWSDMILALLVLITDFDAKAVLAKELRN